jgi:hypothetical protein
MVHKVTYYRGEEAKAKISEALTKKQLHERAIEIKKDREMRESLQAPVICGDTPDEII